jgi:hypothetical protein
MVERVLDLRHLLLRFDRGIRIAFGRQLEVQLGFLELVQLLAPGRERLVQQGALAQDSLRRFAVVPELRRRRLVVELFDPRFAFGDVKDASRTRSGAPRWRYSDPAIG